MWRSDNGEDAAPALTAAGAAVPAAVRVPVVAAPAAVLALVAPAAAATVPVATA